MLAALTTSIPEAPHSTRNWDYRYCWLRDSYFVVQTLNRLGATRTMEAYLHYIDHIIASSTADTLQPLYGITGDPRAEEKIATTLLGLSRHGPGAFRQSRRRPGAARRVRLGDPRGHAAVLRRTAGALGRPDAARAAVPARQARGGDLRGAGRRSVGVSRHACSATRSRRRSPGRAAIAWRASRGASAISIAARDWSARADYMRQEILQGAWSEERQCFTSAFGNRDLDATALLLPELGLLPATDPRFLKTLERIEEELRVGDLLFRYKHADDFGHAGKCLHHLRVLVRERAGRGRARRRSARTILAAARAAQSARPAVRRHLAGRPASCGATFRRPTAWSGVIGSALRLSRSWEEIV